MAFKSEFMKVFKEGLEPYGFKRMKGTDFFGKLINNEILLFISYKSCGAINRGMKAFDIISGIQTIYSKELTTHQLQLSSTSLCKYPVLDTNIKRISHFEYDASSVTNVIKESYNRTSQLALPVLLKANDLKKCLDYLTIYWMGSLYPADRMHRDSVLLILTDDHESFDHKLNLVDDYLLNYYEGNTSTPYYQSSLEVCHSVLHELIDSRDRVWASKELQEAVLSEANRRAEINKAQLRKYGFDI